MERLKANINKEIEYFSRLFSNIFLCFNIKLAAIQVRYRVFPAFLRFAVVTNRSYLRGQKRGKVFNYREFLLITSLLVLLEINFRSRDEEEIIPSDICGLSTVLFVDSQ